MALQHHQDGVGAQQVDKGDAPVGERSRKRFDGCMFLLNHRSKLLDDTDVKNAFS